MTLSFFFLFSSPSCVVGDDDDADNVPEGIVEYARRVGQRGNGMGARRTRQGKGVEVAFKYDPGKPLFTSRREHTTC